MPNPPLPRREATDGRGDYVAVATSGDSSANRTSVAGRASVVDADDPNFKALLKPEEAPPTCVETDRFQMVGALLIMTNALSIGIQTDTEDWPHWPIIEHSFLFLFSLELSIKMCVIGPIDFLFVHADRHWNCFDFFIVGLGIFDFTAAFFGGSGTGGFATIFRIIRLLRILRIFRILKFLKQLYVLIFGLVEAVKAVFWVTVLMVFVLYVCAIVLVKTVGRPDPGTHHEEFMTLKFGSILGTMLTLFILMSSPNLPDYQIEEGLLEEHFLLTLFLCIFIIFGSYGIVALLTGVISESMFEKNEVRKDQLRADHEDMRTNLGERCEELFLKLAEANHAVDGELPVSIVKTLVKDMHEMLEKAGAEITKADTLKIIDFMDINGTNLIGKEEFRGTMEKIAEGLSTMGVQEIASRVGLCESKIEKVQATLEEVRESVAEIRTLLTNPSPQPNGVKPSPQQNGV